MNYFELFEIPVSLTVNKDIIQKKYFELSRKYHPDYFINGSSEEQHHALQASAMLNKAYKTFSREDDTIKYTLTLKGLLEEEEKYSLKPDFLMQMMDINEELADAQMENDQEKKNKIREDLQELQIALKAPVKTIIEQYKDGITTNEDLLKVKDYYFRKKYIERVYRQMEGKL